MKSRKIFLILALNLFSLANLFSYDTAFVRTFGGKFKEVAYDVKQTYDKGFVIVGSTNSFTSGLTSIYVVKTDSSGIFQWSKTFGGVNVDLGRSIQVDADSGYSILGYTNSTGYGGYDMRFIKMDASGNVLWQKTYGGNDWDFGYSHAVLPDGGYVLCGETYSYTNGSSDAYVIRTNKYGDTLWTRHYGGSWNDAANSVIVDSDSTYVIVGSLALSGSNTNGLFIKLDSAGNTLAFQNYGGSNTDVLNSVCMTNDGGFAMQGTSNSFSAGGDNDAYLIKTDNSGNYSLDPVFGSTGADEGTALIKIRNGQLVLTGTLTNFGLGATAMTVYRLNATTCGWQDGAAFGGIYEESGHAITLTNSGGIVFVGSTSTWGQGQEDMYFVKMYNDSIVANYTLQVVQYNDNLLSSIEKHGSNEDGIIISPNPFSTSTLIKIKDDSFLTSKEIKFEVFDMCGKLIHTKNSANLSFEFNRGDLPPGIYFYSVSCKSKIINGKIIIN